MSDVRYPDRLVAKFLRSETWVEEHAAASGAEIPFRIDELLIDGPARVTRVGACTLKAGPGCLVTGTVSHRNRSVLRLRFVGSDETLEPTATHRLWSADRDEWVSAGNLEVGERLLTDAGAVTVAAIDHLDGARQVFNFEVAGAHTYLVSGLHIKSHNAGDCSFAELIEQRIKWLRDNEGLGNTAARFRVIHELGIPTGEEARWVLWDEISGVNGRPLLDHAGEPIGTTWFYYSPE
jgi:hypothetical protein